MRILTELDISGGTCYKSCLYHSLFLNLLPSPWREGIRGGGNDKWLIILILPHPHLNPPPPRGRSLGGICGFNTLCVLCGLIFRLPVVPSVRWPYTGKVADVIRGTPMLLR
jgi:hypothetical protein